MGLPSTSFVVGVAFLLYLSSFVFFALLRIATGISIQRIGYSGFRRISYTPREGIKIEIRGLGLHLHRPTFAQPTWVSVVLTELKITLDLKVLGDKPRKRAPWVQWPNRSSEKLQSGLGGSADSDDDDDDAETQRSKTWERLTRAKERIKRLHRKIRWIRLVDVVAIASSVVLVDVGSVQVSGFTMAVDTRRRTVDRGRLFQHGKRKHSAQRPAEWIVTARSVLFTSEGSDSTELIDHCTLNVHGLLYQELDGLREASVSLKVGRANIPWDDMQVCVEQARRCRRLHESHRPKSGEAEMSFSDLIDELDRPGSREENIVRTVSDSKEFVASILRGIQEIQLAVSHLSVTKRVSANGPHDKPVYLNISTKEIGLDLLRLDPRSPAHLMYFSPDDIAHQALLAVISVSVGIDDGLNPPERLLYIPMATNTVKTTLPSKTIQYDRDKNVADRNTNILFANFVITSPSTDLDPKHLSLLLDIFSGSAQGGNPSRSTPSRSRRRIMSRLLPKASVKLSIHEPVVRVTLPPVEPEKKGKDEFDLLIFAMSSISLDLESSHSASGDLHYSLASNFRISSYHLYYQTASSHKFNLLLADSFELKLQISATPEVAVVASGGVQTFSVYMVRPEINEGIRQIIEVLRSDDAPWSPQKRSKATRPSVLRRLPSWLVHMHLQASDFNIEVAGLDAEVSRNVRGMALHLESWTAEYKADKNEPAEPRPSRRRRFSSRSVQGEDFLLRPASPTSPRRHQFAPTDGRRLSIHTHGLEGFVVESADTWEQTPFLSLPKFEMAFTTSSDQQGQICHAQAHAKSIFLHYSLYRYFAIGVAMIVLRNTFARRTARQATEGEYTSARAPVSQFHIPSIEVDDASYKPGRAEIMTFDLKVNFAQVKGEMPAKPNLMLHLEGLEAGRHRWTNPYGRARLVRLYSETPRITGVWSRVVSVKSVRLDYRQSRRKYGTSYTEDRSFDIATDAIRIAVPHQLVVHKIFDNIVNVAKTSKQLLHRFRTGTSENVLEKGPEGPRRMPKVSLRGQAILFEIEDGSFEWKLGVIYRIGLLEQKQRLAREEAFRVKLKKIQEPDRGNRRGNSRFRAKSAHVGRERGGEKGVGGHSGRFRTSSEPSSERGSSPPRSRHGQRARYDAEGKSGLSGTARASADEAWVKLQMLNAQTWKKRIDHGIKFQSRAVRDLRSLFWGLDELPDEADHGETIMAISQRPSLLAVVISDFNVVIDKPSFPIDDYPSFLHKVGKGMPVDMQYSLLLPMNVQITMGEARVTLRDYPLPLIHVPAIRHGQSPRLPSLSLKTDFVIAEENRDHESTRHVNVVVVPHEKNDAGEDVGGYVVDVPRTVGAVKTYSNISVDINTSSPTRITWGTSYQPAIQDAMQVIESFTKPAVDPSERVGFWDKIRLTFHSRFNIAWKGDGDVHLILKGSRDPYMVTGHGAGFAMCWRGDVRWSICQHDDPRKFMTVDSRVYVLAVPDLSQSARQMWDFDREGLETPSSGVLGAKQDVAFKKTIMKLSGNVQWLAGLVFERNKDDGGRSFSFVPHYAVVFKNPLFAKGEGERPYDAFRGFRSHHIHLSVAVAAPVDRDWSVSNLKPSSNYNSVHLTPRFFSHFFSWWSMFSGVMSLPIRQGSLWPGLEKSSKKFGRHLGTIKYNLLLSPLYLSHIYKHKGGEDFNQVTTSATGLKLKLDSFMLDLHQRREEFRTKMQGPQGDSDGRQNQTTGIRINEVQLDFISADIRAVSATIANAAPREETGAANDAPAPRLEVPSVDLSQFTIPDNDLGWIDMDDFVELDWMLPTESNPETKILPLAYAPRFTYFRQTDHTTNVSGDPSRYSGFGREPTHYCVMSAGNDPRRVQCDLIQERLMRVNEQLEQNERAIGEQELHMIRNAEGKAQLTERLEVLKSHSEALRKKKRFLQATHKSLLKRLDSADGRRADEGGTGSDDEFFEAREDFDPSEGGERGGDSAELPAYISEFNNRFIVHNMQLKWNNSLRNIILRYIHQVSQRRGFVYYMSRRAVKFLLDIVDEQKRAHSAAAAASENPSKAASPAVSPVEDDASVQERISRLLGDGKKTVSANDPDAAEGTKPSTKNTDEDISVDYTAMKSYHVRLIAPQIQLQSEKNIKSAVLVTAKGMQLQVIQIMDKDRVTDTVSGLVQRRFSAAMDSLQVFVTNQQTLSTKYLHMYSGHGYGTAAGSSWPPWVPFEVMFEFNNNPYGFQRVVQRTSASMRYDKYNTLRLKYNDDVTKAIPGNLKSPDGMENRVDHIWVDFPHLRAICDSTQYFAMYIIVLDLLLYNEPMEKTRSERLEKIMLASDFSDLTGAPEMVIMLQDRIRQLEEIKTYFQVHEKYLDRRGWRDRISMEQDLATCEDELFFMMKAITTSQRNADDRAQAEPDAAIRSYISASEIVWHLVREGNQSLAEFQLKNALYDRTENKDGSNHNSMEVGQIHGLNLLPNALYPDMIAPFIENDKALTDGQRLKMLRVHWYMLEDIGGISVLDHFEVNLFPLKIQLEREIGKKLFEYIFPGVGVNGGDGVGSSPFMVKQDPFSGMESAENSERSDDDYGIDPKNLQSEAKDTASSGMSLHLRLHPTLTLPDKPKDNKDQTSRPKPAHHLSRQEFHRLGLFRDSHRTVSGTNLARSGQSPRIENSSDSQLVTPRANSRAPSNAGLRTSTDLDRPKRFALHRTGSGSSKATAKMSGRNDDLNQMLTRASSYMTLAYVKVSSMVLCLSYKGKGQRNFEDVHNLVFRMPTLEYRNKTWSNLDLALQLKRDVIRALISHTGAIIGNKFIRHQPTRAQQGRLRQIANSASLLSTQLIPNSANSTPSTKDHSPVDGSDGSVAEPRRSFTSGRGGTVSRNNSYASSLHSLGISGFQAAASSGLEQSSTVENYDDSDDDEGERFADELSKVDQTEPDRSAIKNSLSRHLTGLGHISRLKDSSSTKSEEADDGHRIRNKILGKFRHPRQND